MPSALHPTAPGAEAAARILTRLPGLDAEQGAAVQRALSAGVSVPTGGPGTGKTTLARAIVALADELGLAVTLCAPTGAAAQRLAGATGSDADTVHAVLGWGASVKVRATTAAIGCASTWSSSTRRRCSACRWPPRCSRRCLTAPASC